MTVAPDYLRQLGFFNPDEHAGAACTFVGVGGIGSFASFAVAKLGVPNLTLIDPDLVEAHNLPSQMFDRHQYDYHKVTAAHDTIEEWAGVTPTKHVARIESDGWHGDTLALGWKPTGLVISGLDSMQARADLWQQAVRLNPRVPLYIDGRLDGETIVIYAVNPVNMTDVAQYEATLKSDDDVPAGNCTERAIIDVGFTVGAQIARLVRRHYCGEDVDKITWVDCKSNRVFSGGWIEE